MDKMAMVDSKDLFIILEKWIQMTELDQIAPNLPWLALIGPNIYPIA